MKTFERALLMVVHNSTILAEHMLNCDSTGDCSVREFLRATFSKSFIHWFALHGVSEQTIHRAEFNEAHARIIEDLIESIKNLTDGDKDLDIVVSAIRAKTMTAADQIRSHASSMRN
jgi:hypothetical protein